MSEEGKRRASSSSHARTSPDATNTKLAYFLITSCRMAKRKKERINSRKFRNKVTSYREGVPEILRENKSRRVEKDGRQV